MATAGTIARPTQTVTEALDVLRRAEQQGRSVKIDGRGELVLMNPLALFFEGLKGRLRGEQWLAQVRSERNRQVLAAFDDALERDFQHGNRSLGLRNARAGVAEAVHASFAAHLENGTLPRANELAQQISSGLARELGQYEREQHELVERGLSYFGGPALSPQARELLDACDLTLSQESMDARFLLGQMRSALLRRTEELAQAWAGSGGSSDAQAAQLRAHHRALTVIEMAIHETLEGGEPGTLDRALQSQTQPATPAAEAAGQTEAEAAGQTQAQAPADTEPLAPTRLPIDHWLSTTGNPDHPINRALDELQLPKEFRPSRDAVQTAFATRFMDHCARDASLIDQGCPHHLVRHLAEDVVFEFKPSRRFIKSAAPLAQGADGRIWSAEDRKTHRPYILKEAKPEGVEALRNEAKVLARFQGRPGIVQSHGFFPQQNLLVLKPYALGSANKPEVLAQLTLADKAKALVGLGQALQALHEENTLHCDVNLKNMLVGADKEVVLSDFGSAKTFARGIYTPPVTEQYLRAHPEWLDSVGGGEITLDKFKQYLRLLAVADEDELRLMRRYEDAPVNPFVTALQQGPMLQAEQRAFVQASFNLLAGAGDDRVVPAAQEDRLSALAALPPQARTLAAELFDPAGDAAQSYARLPELFAMLQTVPQAAAGPAGAA